MMAYICKFNSKTLGKPLSILNSLTCEALDSNLSLQDTSLYWLTADFQMKHFLCDKPSSVSGNHVSVLNTPIAIVQILLTNYLII